MRKTIEVDEKVPLLQAIPLSLQHLFAMFGASVLVPSLFGINPAIVLLMNGIGTLLFIVITKGKSPAFLGSSFAFLTPTFVILSNPNLSFNHALGGFVVSGAIFCIVGIIIKFCGSDWVSKILPPAAMGPVIALIGLELAGVAAQSGGLLPADGNINRADVTIFVVTLATAIIGSTTFKKFWGVIPILIAIVVGYITAFLLGAVDLTPIQQASFFEMPVFNRPIFEFSSIIIILPATIVVLSEHIGHQLVTGNIINRDLIKDPGLHRSLLGDGISTMLSGFCGSVPTTTYGENIGVMALTKVYSVWIIAGAAIISILISFNGIVTSAITTIPSPVMGGISFLLYGMIATSGIRLIVESKVDYSKSKNLVLTSVVFITGLSGAYINIGEVKLTGMALATVVGMILSGYMLLIEKLNLSNDAEIDEE